MWKPCERFRCRADNGPRGQSPPLANPSPSSQQQGKRMSAHTTQEGWNPSLRYPDPAIEVLDKRFQKYLLNLASVERLYTGTRWGEGPVYFGDGRFLLWTDFPNERILKWEESS